MMDAQLPRVAAPACGFPDDLDERFDDACAAGLLPNVHAVLAARDGHVFFERYLTGADTMMVRPLGLVRFTADTLHDMRSVTKSIVGLLYGIALADGVVPPPEAGLLAQFPEHADLAGPERAGLTVAHALSMALGTEWDELSLPYSDPRNSEIAMEWAPDRIRFVLERPVTGPPGERWVYNGGATALLARLIARGTGRTIEEFAADRLFTPLGCGPTAWQRGRDGVAMAASGLRLRPEDLLRVGICVLAQGLWAGRQVIPAAWLKLVTSPAVSMPDGRRYGYHWYLGAVPMTAGDSVAPSGSGQDVVFEPTVSAMGNGGQRLFLVPRLNLTVVVTAGNYDGVEQWRPPLVVLRDVLLPALRG